MVYIKKSVVDKVIHNWYNRKKCKSITKECDLMNNSQAWDYAIGMIKVDGLEPTEEFKKYIEKEKKGEITMEDAKRFLDKKYKMKESTNA